MIMLRETRSPLEGRLSGELETRLKPLVFAPTLPLLPPPLEPDPPLPEPPLLLPPLPPPKPPPLEE
jgi:hypothetical protein